MNKISVIIPALNEEKSISHVINSIPKYIHQIIVVDNGSTDKTSVIAKSKGAIILNELNKGYGYACLKGIKFLKTNPPDYLFVTAWNYADLIRSKENWFKGVWVTPLPFMRFF